MAENTQLAEGVAEIRVAQRERQRCNRKRKKDEIVNENRACLVDIESLYKHISLDEVRQMSLSIKKVKDNMNILRRIRISMCLGNEHIEAFLKVDGGLSVLVGLLCGNDAEKQLEAATCLTNLACGSHKSTQKVAKASGAYLVSYLKSSSHFLQDQCAWAVGNIANDCVNCFSLLNAQGVLPALESLLSSSNTEVLQSAAFALNAATQYETPELLAMLKASLANTLLSVLNQQNVVHHQTLIDVMFALFNISGLITQCFSEEQQMTICDKVLTYLYKSLLCTDVDVLLATPTVRCLGGLSMGSSTLCSFIISRESFKSCVAVIMGLQYHHLKKELVWVLSNLLVSSRPSDCSIDWCQVVESIKPFISPLDSDAIQVIYFLCILITAEKGFVTLFRNNGITNQVEALSACGKEELETAARTLHSLLTTAEI